MIMQRSERLASLRAESMLSIEPFFPKANFFLKRRKETVRPLSGGPQSGTFLSDGVRWVSQKIAVAISNSFYVVLCPMLPPITNFTHIG